MSYLELIKWRKLLGLSTSEAAQALGVTPNAYRAMEAGKAKINTRTRLACLALYVGEDKLAAPWLH